MPRLHLLTGAPGPGRSALLRHLAAHRLAAGDRRARPAARGWGGARITAAPADGRELRGDAAREFTTGERDEAASAADLAAWVRP